MLERIEEIQGIGLLHDLKGKKYSLSKTTLIYSDNGRGKSTLASILRSVSNGDVRSIADRRTIDGVLEPKVTWQFSSGHRVKFENETWSEQRPEIMVFDVDFIEKNVHSGGIVKTDQRKSLLEFALGSTAVGARKLEENASTEAATASDVVNSLTKQLAGYHQGIILSDFERMEPVKDANIQIEEIQKRILSANNITSLLSKPVPSTVQLPGIDITALFKILGKSLEDIQADAERLVHSHIALIDKDGAESWLNSGHHFDNGITCPYCGQGTSGVTLIRAYQTYFNAAYADLKKQVAVLERGIAVRIGEGIVEAFVSSFKTEQAISEAWNTHIKNPAIMFDSIGSTLRLTELREFLLELVEKKQANPTISIGTQEEKEKAENLWNQIINDMSECNRQISTAKSIIEQFRISLGKETSTELQSKLLRIHCAMRRHESPVIDLFSKLAHAKKTSVEATKIKKKAREDLDTAMSTILGQYEISINQLLVKIGAAFQIEKMATNFRGGAARSEYGLRLRGKSVQLEGGRPSFSTVLSEGDKRTLAFAFFVASTLEHPELSSRIIVIDDPMCSLDINRKQHTKTVLKQIRDKAEQIIVLAHDPYFIRDLRDELMLKDGSSNICSLQLRHATNDYSDMAEYNIDKECESTYYRHHRTLKEFCDTGTNEKIEVAKAIRPFLEGYLHRRFPSFIPRDLLFGQVVEFIRTSTESQAVSHAKNLISELQEINTYAGQFHHDTNPGFVDTIPVNHTELKGFSMRALQIVHTGNVQ